MMLRPALLTLVSFPVGAALLSAAVPQGAQAQFLRSHNSNAPVNFSADRIEVQDRADRVVVSGNVHVTQGPLTLDAARMTVAYSNGDGIEINRINAAGDVRVTSGNSLARGDTAIYDLNSRIITMVGSVVLQQNGNRVSGNRLVIDLASGRSAVDGRASAPGGGGGGGRVTGTFTVPERK
jgi:lipopolysaccharide export system protein LptA